MDKIYERTRYLNIYKHGKNGNYMIRYKNTTVSKINGKKIYDIKAARDYIAKLELNIKKIEQSSNSYLFKDLWNEYIKYCNDIMKLSFNTLKKKKVFYNCYYKDLENEKVNNISKNDVIDFINSEDTTNKQKNEILKHLRAFFNWCENNKEIIVKNPTKNIKYIKVPKVEMKYWTIEEFSKFISYIEKDTSEIGRRTKILVLLGLYLGDRIGESRALTWNSINESHCTIQISHSINYDTKSSDFLSTTKTYSSDRIVDVSEKLIIELNKYKDYLINKQINVKDLIFYNYNTNRPYSDVTLRKAFHKYCELAKVPKIRMYDLRHTYVALMMTDGWELYHISKRLGHSNYSTTVNKYGHLENKVRKEIAKTTDKYISW
jgi:Site-specific recombinase XerD